MKTSASFLVVAGLLAFAVPAFPAAKPNVMLITVDDMGSWETVGSFGGPIAGATPNMDRLATEGIRFIHAHCVVAVCYPDRNAINSGRYPFNSGGEGFYPLRVPNVPILPGELKKAGYRVGLINKLPHDMPYKDFRWDVTVSTPRNPESFYQETKKFIEEAKAKGQPFYLMNNSTDPHRPFHNSNQEQAKAVKETGKAQTRKAGKQAAKGEGGDAEVVDSGGSAMPSRVYTTAEVKPWGHLPDLPPIREEIAQYFSSVRRCDDTLGAMMRAVKDAGVEENTLVIFLSDNGPSFPFSKANCYPVSTRTPLILRWPGHIKPGLKDVNDMVCTIDLMPTILDAAGVPLPPDLDGLSLRPSFEGKSLPGRDIMFTVMGQTSSKLNLPTRCAQTPQFCYLYNPWSNGKRICRTESQGGLTWAAMQAAAKTDPAMADRCNFYTYRAREEFYDLTKDPHSLKNLIADPQYAKEIERFRGELEKWMVRTKDPALEAFRNRTSAEAQEKFMAKVIADCGGK